MGSFSQFSSFFFAPLIIFKGCGEEHGAIALLKRDALIWDLSLFSAQVD
jgi:hypothetical protein